MARIRLQKLLADRGVASRRHAADLIRKGHVREGAEVIREPGRPIDEHAKDISVKGKRIPPPLRKKRTIMLNKPRGYICSTNAQSDRSETVYALISGLEKRLVIAGRLDRDSEGLLLLSNDGDLVHQITHARFQHGKTYEVRVDGTVTAAALKRLNSRMRLDGYMIQQARVRVASMAGHKTQLEFVLHEGRNRQIRKMCECAGLRVRNLRRVAIGALALGSLRPGQWRDLSARDLRALAAGARSVRNPSAA